MQRFWKSHGGQLVVPTGESSWVFTLIYLINTVLAFLALLVEWSFEGKRG